MTTEFLPGERALGELWRDTPKNKGMTGGATRTASGTFLESLDANNTLTDLGLDEKRAARDLTLADIEESFFEKSIADRKANQDLSIFGVYADIEREWCFTKRSQIVPVRFRSDRVTDRAMTKLNKNLRIH